MSTQQQQQQHESLSEQVFGVLDAVLDAQPREFRADDINEMRIAAINWAEARYEEAVQEQTPDA